MTAVERMARRAWGGWAIRRKRTICSGCGEFRYCGRGWKGRRWLCVDCHDLEGVG